MMGWLGFVDLFVCPSIDSIAQVMLHQIDADLCIFSAVVASICMEIQIETSE